VPFFKNKVNKTNPRFVFVLTAAYSQRGGIEKFNQQLLECWIKLFPKDEITIIVQLDRTKELSHLRSPKVNVIGCGNRCSIVSKIKMGSALFKAICVNRTDHVIVGHVSWSFFVWALSKVYRFHYSLIVHGIEVFYPNCFKRRGISGAKFLWANSNYTQEQCSNRCRYPKEKIIRFPPLAEETKFKISSFKSSLKDKFKISHQKVLFTVARLDEREKYKGVDVVMQALQQLKRDDFVYIIAGSGSDLARLQQIAKLLGVSQSVRFVGKQDEQSLLELFQSADIYVMPSYEGFGIVYLEALLCGIPVISGNRDGSSDPLQNGKLGFQVDRNSPAEVADAILEIEKGDDRRCQPEWLRSETVRVFGQEKYTERIKVMRSISLEN